MNRWFHALILSTMTLTNFAHAGNGDFIVDGKLGIGTTTGTSNPTARLDVNDSNSTTDISNANASFINISNAFTSQANTKFGIVFSNPHTPRIAGIYANTNYNTNGNSSLLFATRGLSGDIAERVRINYDGNVGIGTSNPVAKLHVDGATSVTDITSNNANFINISNVLTSQANTKFGIVFSNPHTPRIAGIYANTNYNTNGNTSLIFATRGITGDIAERVRINYDGNVGIGTVIPATKLHVVVPTVGDPSLSLQRDSSSRFDFVQGIVGVTGDSLLIKDVSLSRDYIMLRDGKVGIGKTNPAQQLDVGGSIAVNGNIVHSSDAKFKKDLLTINSPLEKVLSLNGLSYKWKTEEFEDKGFPEGRHYGVIAQEIEKVLPEVVNTAPDGSKAVAYTEIIPVLIEAMKEQQKIIETQMERIGRLEQRLETPLSKIEREVE